MSGSSLSEGLSRMLSIELKGGLDATVKLMSRLQTLSMRQVLDVLNL